MADYKTHDPKGWCGNPRRGAAMGRGTWEGDKNFSGTISLRQVRLNNGGYDCNGTYFGHGERLYWYSNEDGSIDGMLRSSGKGDDRASARAQVLFIYRNAKVRK